ncbi:MAG: ArsR family transcriptional regulator [Alphaproteobacteria bacterium]|nr:ArsR family transcriptional regulator [Alphaproteobacteria bacterium]
MDAQLRALADGTRREILALAALGELSANQIAEHFPISRPAVSQHLKVLRDVGLLVVRSQGTQRLYRTDRSGLDALLRDLGSFWDERLLRLKLAAEAAEWQSVEN